MRIASDPARVRGMGRGWPLVAPPVMPDGPAERVGSDGRTAEILPASARVGLLTDCKGSSDEITQRDLPCRRSGIGAQIADCCSNLSESGQSGATAHILDEQVDEIACESRQRIGVGYADRQLTLGPVAFERDEAQRHRLNKTARGAFGQHADVRLDHPAGRLEVADPDASARHALHVGGRAFQEGVDRARFVQADEVVVERRDERRRCMDAAAGGWPIIGRSSTEPHGAAPPAATRRRGRDLCTIVRMARRAAPGIAAGATLVADAVVQRR